MQSEFEKIVRIKFSSEEKELLKKIGVTFKQMYTFKDVTDIDKKIYDHISIPFYATGVEDDYIYINDKPKWKSDIYREDQIKYEHILKELSKITNLNNW